jgi:hypothetical protein
MPPPTGLVSVIKQLEESADVQLDVGYRQDRAKVRMQLKRRSGRSEEKRVDRAIESMKQHVADVSNGIQPHRLPTDYLDFLEWYGGLALFGPDESYYLSINGVGPMVLEWYTDLLGEDKVERQGMRTYLPIGRLSFRTGPPGMAVKFYIAFEQGIDALSIIGVGPTDDEPPKGLLLPEDDVARSNKVKTLAGSFTEWLVQTSQTNGLFGYKN